MMRPLLAACAALATSAFAEGKALPGRASANALRQVSLLAAPRSSSVKHGRPLLNQVQRRNIRTGGVKQAQNDGIVGGAVIGMTLGGGAVYFATKPEEEDPRQTKTKTEEDLGRYQAATKPRWGAGSPLGGPSSGTRPDDYDQNHHTKDEVQMGLLSSRAHPSEHPVTRYTHTDPRTHTPIHTAVRRYTGPDPKAVNAWLDGPPGGLFFRRASAVLGGQGKVDVPGTATAAWMGGPSGKDGPSRAPSPPAEDEDLEDEIAAAHNWKIVPPAQPASEGHF